MRYNTGNPVGPDGSSSPFDLHDNAGNLDLGVNSEELIFTDRTGKNRDTWAGFEKKFSDLLISQGYESVYLEYAPGVVVERQTQLVQVGGELYRVKDVDDLPLALSGDWEIDAPKLLVGGIGWFQQVGSGSVIRPFAGKVGEQFSITDFGASPAIADNSAAIAAACAAAAGKPVIVPRTDDGNVYAAPSFVAPLGTLFNYQGGAYISGGDVNNAVVHYVGAGEPGEHRADTITRGYGVEINAPLTGVGAASTYMLNRFYIRNDRLDAQNDGFPGSKVDGVIIQHNFGGAGCRGGRHAFESILTQTAPTESDNTDRNYVGAVSVVNSLSGDGGTSGTKRGSFFAHNFYANLTNSMYTQHVNGCESNVLIDASSSAQYRAGYSAVSAGVKQGDDIDAAYAIDALGLTGAQWKYGIHAGIQNGRQPLSLGLIRDETNASTLISVSVAKAVLYDSDDGRMRISLASSNYYSDNYAVRIGGTNNVANTPLLQFQCGSTDVNLYAGRIMAAGGIPLTAGSGVCRIEFRQTLLRETAPLAANTYTCGTAALPWSGGFTQSAFTVTSDERQKQDIEAIPDEVLDAWAEVEYLQFRLTDRVAEKGDGARLHTGVIAQRVRDVFLSHGIDPYARGVLCHDSWDATEAEYVTWEEERDEDGNVTKEAGSELVVPAREAGDLYTIRYQEADALTLALLKREDRRKGELIDQLKDRISSIEAALDSTRAS
ncbi:tail fiber domain-containing protein [Pseudomonas asiatica]|uniref:Tail fiber domain-containing protein n=1 Tax=Pseudomonas asiatica TaxID=2219225 RepID=A0A9X4I1G0_9PSED|nr:tail fiber domain-containing protein [Pseudomonas asiatica]MDD2114157.1 tail fiber domain-containing protein [Pseudomonas asiatica]